MARTITDHAEFEILCFLRLNRYSVLFSTLQCFLTIMLLILSDYNLCVIYYLWLSYPCCCLSYWQWLILPCGQLCEKHLTPVCKSDSSVMSIYNCLLRLKVTPRNVLGGYEACHNRIRNMFNVQQCPKHLFLYAVCYVTVLLQLWSCVGMLTAYHVYHHASL